MKKIGRTLTAILISGLWGIIQAQDISIAPFAKLQCGYGSFVGYTESNFDLFTARANEEQSTYRIFGGVDYSVCLGGTLLRSGNDIYNESFLDILLVHKRISGPENGAGFTGIGAQCRYQFFYAGLLLGMAGNRNELPINTDDNNVQVFGDLHGVTPMFKLGLRAPLNSERTLFLDIPFNLVVSRNRLNDSPVDEGTIYEWYSINLGICYYISFGD